MFYHFLFSIEMIKNVFDSDRIECQHFEYLFIVGLYIAMKLIEDERLVEF